jgi:putative glutamine amidotransferase
MSYVSSVIRAGGCPVLLPPSKATPVEVLKVVHGLIITGGPDVNPALYGAERRPTTDEPRVERDAWESALCLAALGDDLPLLAVCRGMQLLNVALGGTLQQHLPDSIGHDDHRVGLGKMNRNIVSIGAGSASAAILGTEAEGMCHHHQAVDRLGRRLKAVGFAPDGIIEAVEVAGQEFAIGVQWHPEDDPEDDRLFRALVDAAAGYRADVEVGFRQ